MSRNEGKLQAETITINSLFFLFNEKFALQSKKFNVLFSPNVTNVELEIKKNINASCNKVESLLFIYMGINMTTATTVLYELVFSENKLPLQSLIPKDSLLFRPAQTIFCLLFLIWHVTPNALVPMYYLIPMLYCKIRLLQLVDYINQINGSEETFNAYDMSEIIKSLIEDQIKIKKCHQKIFGELHLFASIYVLNGAVILGTYSLLAIFYYTHTEMHGLVVCAGYVFYCYTIAEFAQEYSDNAVLCAKAVSSLKWYQWDVKCQKSYLTMLIQFSQRFRVPIFSFLDVNLGIFKQCIRTSYVTANFLYTLKYKSKYRS
ncbi:hypothetical protein ABEB36_010217 [Hypothenemus hampei]|uniref:Odorant receptor n=1 Tax=Hypothenemus hampei TaxID=57062 RepID=A0ABD1EKZ4_HYPHA